MNRTNRVKYRLRCSFDTEMIQVTKAELSSFIMNQTPKQVMITDLVFMKRHAVFFRELPPNIPVLPIEVKPDTKNIQDLNQIYDFLLKEKVERSTNVLVFGGGTLTDLAAFAASTFKRGVHLVIIPTTVVGMVDAAIGGKTAYDLHHLKNMIGTFYPAEEVFFCPDFLKTLEPVDILNGWAEVVKMFLIHKDMTLPEMLDVTYLPPKDLIWDTAKLKLSICVSDLQDRGERRLLNLGHTFGHVLEALSLCEIPHGIAVAFGIHTAAVLSHKLVRINDITMNRIRNLFHEFPLTDYVTEELIKNVQKDGLEKISQDKKAENGLKLVLFKDWRELEVVDTINSQLAVSCLVEVLKEYLCGR